MQYIKKHRTNNLEEARPLIENYSATFGRQIHDCFSLESLQEISCLFVAEVPDDNSSPVVLVLESGIPLLVRQSPSYPPEFLDPDQLSQLQSSYLPELNKPCLFYGKAYLDGHPVVICDLLNHKAFSGKTALEAVESLDDTIKRLSATPPQEAKIDPPLKDNTGDSFLLPDPPKEEHPSSSLSSTSGPSTEAASSEQNNNALEDPDRIVRQEVKKRSAGFTTAGAFLADTEIYSMYEYASSLRKILSDDEWDKMSAVVTSLGASAKLLHMLHREHYFMEVAVGDNESLLNAIAKVNELGGMVQPKTVKQVQEVDHVLARLPQAAAAGQTFLKINNSVINGECTQFLNLFDNEHPIYCSVESTSQLMYLRAANSATDHITSYARKYSPQDVENIPKTVHFCKQITEEQLDFLHDVQVSRKKNDPGSIILRLRGHGGELYGNHNQQKPIHHILRPLARITTQGLPPVLALRDMYVQDPQVRRMIDTDMIVKCKKRAEPENKAHAEWSVSDLAFWSNVGITSSGSLKILNLSFTPTDLQENFDSILDHIHHINRLHVVNLSTDLDAFQGLYARTTTMPSETLAIRVAADLFLEGHDIDIVDAEDFVSFGFCNSTTGKLRAPCYKNHDVTANVDNRNRFDVAPHGKSALIDMSNPHPTPIYIGGDNNWEDKITAGPKEKRQPQYWDFEPEFSAKDFEGKYVHSRQAARDNKQYLHARERLQAMKDGKWERVVVICPLRHARILVKDFNISFVLPAPIPMLTSVVLFATRKATMARISLDHLTELALLLVYKQENVLATFQKGSAGYDSLISRKLEPENIQSFYALLKVWQEKNRARYVEGFKGGPEKRVTNNLQKLLRSDEASARKGNINALIEEQGRKSFTLLKGTRATE